jgi:septum formation topological specificity factor MinE
MFNKMLSESVRDYLRTETTHIQVNTIIQFIEKTQFSDLKENQVFVLSIRNNLPNNDELILWNTDYNYEQERIKSEEKKGKNKVGDNIKGNRSVKSDRGQMTSKQNEKVLPIENRYEVLSDMLIELNKKFDDSIDPEFCVERFIEFKPIGDVMKPSQFSFDEMLLEHQMIIDSQLTFGETKQNKTKKSQKTSEPMVKRRTEQLTVESEISYKSKYEIIQGKLKKLRNAVSPIICKYSKIDFDGLQKKKGFILSMINVIEYLDSSHDSGDSCSEYGDYN